MCGRKGRKQTRHFYTFKSPNPGVFHLMLVLVPGLSMGRDSLPHSAQRCRMEPPSRESLGVPFSWGAFWSCSSHTWTQFLPEIGQFPVILPVPMEDAPLIPQDFVSHFPSQSSALSIWALLTAMGSSSLFPLPAF